MKRIEYLDATKGFAIFLMVFAHAIAWSFDDYRQVVILNGNQDSGIKCAGFLWQLVYSFHMPLFFFISGFFSDLKGPLWQEIQKKSQRLLIPYVTTGFLILLVRPTYGYWFLFTLWQLQIVSIFLSWFLQRINKKDNVLIDFFIIALTYFSLKWLCKHCCFTNPLCDFNKYIVYYIPFFLGFMYNKHRCIKNFLEGKYLFYLVLFITLFSCRYIKINGEFSQMLIMMCNFLDRFSATSVLGSLLFIEFFRLESNNQVRDLFSYLGKNTFYIYVFHIFFVVQIKQVGSYWIQTNMETCITTQILYGTIVSAIAITLSLVCATFVKKSTLLDRLFFGNIKKDAIPVQAK